jgi:hypothetical protein
MVIGIVGTAKNTGKTTTLNTLLGEAARRSIAVAVTGIGYDGEEIDNITNLPKPRITIQQGSIVATSERCLTDISDHIQILERTGMFTSLGEIIILRAVRTGMIVIAGPNKRSDLTRLTTMLQRYQPGMIFVDGSLNRIAPMSVVDKVIVTTGGSRSENIEELADEMHAIESFFRVPLCSDQVEPGMSVPYLADQHDVHVLLYRSFGPGEAIEITGPVSLKGMEYLAQQLQYHRYPFRTLVIPDPFTLLMAGASDRIQQAAEQIRKSGIAIQLRRTPTLSFVTVNPFVPRFDGMTYSSSFLDAASLITAVRSRCSVPVYNTAETAPQEIFDRCF